jgi:hypothetical protein
LNAHAATSWFCATSELFIVIRPRAMSSHTGPMGVAVQGPETMMPRPPVGRTLAAK